MDGASEERRAARRWVDVAPIMVGLRQAEREPRRGEPPEPLGPF